MLDTVYSKCPAHTAVQVPAVQMTGQAVMLAAALKRAAQGSSVTITTEPNKPLVWHRTPQKMTSWSAGWPAAACILPASAQARNASASSAGRSGQRQPEILSGHRQRPPS